MQLGWITVTSAEGTPLSVEAVPRQLPRISALRPADWVETDLLVEGVERRLALASEGRGSFQSACWPQVFKVELEEQLDASKVKKINIVYLLGRWGAQAKSDKHTVDITIHTRLLHVAFPYKSGSFFSNKFKHFILGRATFDALQSTRRH